MKKQSLKIGIQSPRKVILWVAVVLGIFSFPALAFAQITPDHSLGSERSRLINRPVDQQPADVIEGGAVRGRNLFHSFAAFNIKPGQRVYFANPNGVENIFSRITGSTHSNLAGTLGVEGSANLFLLNPNGILFGRNASLDLRGSFLATTANSIRFANDFQFSAIAPQAVPLLTVDVPIGLQFGHHSGSIIDRSAAQSFESGSLIRDPDRDPALGLRVRAAQTLALIGGDIHLQGGGLVAGSQPTAPGGQIELGSVTGSGSVSLIPVAQGWRLDYRDVSDLGEINLSQGSSINASGFSGGAIRVQASRINLNNSIIFSVTQGSDSGDPFTLNASEQIELTDQALILAQTRGTGNSGNLRVATPRLTIRSGSALGSTTLSDGQGGDVIITVPDAIVVENGLLFAQTCDGGICGKGASGNLTLKTRQLLIQAGGQVNTTTFGAGEGGNLLVQAQIVTLDGIERDATGHPVLRTVLGRQFPFPSGLYAGTEVNSEGNGGELRVETQRLSLRGGAVLYTGTFGRGNAGRLIIDAAESAEISGGAVDANVPTSLVAYSGGLGDGFLSIPNAIGAGNNIRIKTGELIIQDGGQVGVSSINPNAPGAGRMTIDAPLIRLNRGTLNAQTASGDRASIALRGTNLLLMQNQSRITTNAGLNGGEGAGGNIQINARFAVTGESENSDITANARQRNAGNVAINANTTGFSVSDRLTSYSDITAFSEQGINGTITLSNPQVNPTPGLIELPANLIDRSTQIAQGCASRTYESSRFVATGRGGLPLSPDEALRARTIVSPEWVGLDAEVEDRPAAESQRQHEPSLDQASATDSAIVEASGFSRDATGKAILVAQSHLTQATGSEMQTWCDRP
jgi:filamentous hemagglutinin family protein